MRAEEQQDRRHARIAELEDMVGKIVGKLEAQDEGQTVRGRRASDRGAYGRFIRAVAEAEMTRFLKADLQADRFSWSVDEDAIARAELFDGKLALLTNARDLTAAEIVQRYKALANIKRGFCVLKSDIEIAPVHHRPPDRIRTHADLLPDPGSPSRHADALEGQGPALVSRLSCLRASRSTPP